MSTRTIITLQLEVHDSQPYDNSWTAEAIRERATKHALDQIACLNRSDLRVVGQPKVKLVIAEDT
jgi:hypothetical protein